MKEIDINIQENRKILIYLGSQKRWNKIVPSLKQYFTIVNYEVISSTKAQVKPKVLLIIKRLIRHITVLWKLRHQAACVLIGGFSYDDLILTLYAKLIGLPVIVRMRVDIEYEHFAEWELKPVPIKQLFRLQWLFCRRQILTRVDGILSVSEFLQNQIIEHAGINPAKVHTVYNPVDFTAFDNAQPGKLRAKQRVPADAGIILTVTNFNYYKKYYGIVYYLPVIVKILKENHGWYFIVVGAGFLFERGRSNILSLIPDEIRNRVLFTGYYTPVEEALKDSDIVLHLSCYDAAPNIVLEAQAAGKPVIVHDQGGSPELLQRRYKGFKCVVSDENGLYQSLTILINDEQMRISVGKENKNALESCYQFDKIAIDLRENIMLILDQLKSSHN